MAGLATDVGANKRRMFLKEHKIAKDAHGGDCVPFDTVRFTYQGVCSNYRVTAHTVESARLIASDN